MTNYELEVYDTSADENLAEQRKAIYKNTHLFVLCVSSVSRESLNSIAKWKAEIEAVAKDVPIVLFITKIDLRESMPQEALTEQEILDAVK